MAIATRPMGLAASRLFCPQLLVPWLHPSTLALSVSTVAQRPLLPRSIPSSFTALRPSASFASLALCLTANFYSAAVAARARSVPALSLRFSAACRWSSVSAQVAPGLIQLCWSSA